MKTSIEWLNEYTDINVDAKTLADRLTMTCILHWHSE